MIQEKQLEDKELGTIIFHRNSRAKRYIIRIKPDCISVTMPIFGSYKTALSFFNENRKRILAAKERQKEKEVPKKEYDEAELNKKARAYLPLKLQQLAKEHGFTYTSLKIQRSRTRWGSCSSKKNINLSHFLMILPEHLIDYVILHELCHTIHMNHSPAFWTLLDTHTNNRSKELRKELRGFKI
jgi:Predicted metal-dependent hydrolase